MTHAPAGLLERGMPAIQLRASNLDSLRRLRLVQAQETGLWIGVSTYLFGSYNSHEIGRKV